MRVAVICVGNELLLDEGAGPATGRYLASRWVLPAEVDVIDCATMGMAILADLRAHDRALVLDAVDVPGAVPGTLFSFEPDDVATSGQMASLHEMRFGDVLQAAELIGVSCAGHCLGVQAENISPDRYVRGLTPRVAAAVPLLAATAARWLRDELGLDVVDRVAGTDPARAGQLPAPEGARDFSGTRRAPALANAWAPALETQGGVRDPATGVMLPLVFGDADASVMAGYLASGLRAVGAGDVRREPADSAATDAAAGGSAAARAATKGVSTSSARVTFTLPAMAAPADVDALIARFGLLDGGAGAEGRRLSAIVDATITDYDCDALIGACQRLTAGR